VSETFDQPQDVDGAADSGVVGTWSDESEFSGWEDDSGLGDELEAQVPTPTLAVVGRPNVGKSTLVNRIIGRREAVVQDIPGVTRDRVSYEALWRGRKFTVVDTGGWEPDAAGLQGAVAAQAERAMLTTDAVLVVVDAAVGATATEEAMAKVLRRSRRPVILAVNKVDDERAMADAAALWSLGLGEPYPVSALHGRGSGDLLDAVLDALPATPSEFAATGTGPRRVALLGKPNVGKSSLLNKLSGDSRSVVDAVAGTTIDPVDSLVELDGQVWRFVDTAGLRRRVHQASGMEFYASLRTQTALEAAEVALVIAMNKADLVDADRREEIERELSRDLARVTWAERINISAQTGRGVHRLAPAMQTALDSWDRRIPTGRLNSWLGELIQATPPPVRSGKQPKVLFATQAANRPPTFVLFTSGFLEAGYRRFIERRLREDFVFSGSPVRVNVRVREKRGRKG
jgi:GTP-binding protein